uniref:Secreted peptide n=1 Tax=Arundo donax TaxID=35708 RepID=A0A0A9DLW0_ARUDO
MMFNVIVFVLFSLVLLSPLGACFHNFIGFRTTLTCCSIIFLFYIVYYNTSSVSFSSFRPCFQSRELS